MPDFIEYKRNGQISKHLTLDWKHPQISPLGQKVRITDNDGKTYIGYLDTPFEEGMPNTIQITQLDVTPKRKLPPFGDGDKSMIIPINKIAKIEAILYSNPRWGTPPSNTFEFD